MDRKDFFKILKEDIHSTVIATIDEDGLPVTRVIDIMLTDNDSLYFITAKGKAFYSQLMAKKYVSITGMTMEEGSINKKAISICGKIENIGNKFLDEVFKENPYMEEIYPNKDSRVALQVFRLYEGQGEYFDLSTKPITRKFFQIGKNNDKAVHKGGYFISDKCVGCKICYSKCPQKCIDINSKPFIINQDHCLHCGNCYSVCPFSAVKKI